MSACKLQLKNVLLIYFIRIVICGSLPALVEPRCSQCTIDKYNGSVITFDGSTEMVTNATNRKYLISKVYQADAGNRTDQCKYMLRAATDENVSLFRCIEEKCYSYGQYYSDA